jgi:hypothetical protein
MKISKIWNSLRDRGGVLFRWSGRFYLLLLTLSASAVLVGSTGCVIGLRGQELLRVTPEVGLVITYPASTNVHLHDVVSGVSPSSAGP